MSFDKLASLAQLAEGHYPWITGNADLFFFFRTRCLMYASFMQICCRISHESEIRPIVIVVLFNK